MSAGPSFGARPELSKTASIVNFFSAGGADPAYATSAIGTKAITSGALTAALLERELYVSGAGVVNIVATRGVDATSRTHRLKITLDGRVIFDATTAARALSGSGIIAIGHIVAYDSGASTYMLGPQPIAFQSSLLVEYASSLTETAKTQILVSYETNL